MSHTGPPQGPPPQGPPPYGPPSGPPLGPRPRQPPGPPAHRTAADPARTGQTALGVILVISAAVLAVLVLVLLHTAPNVEASGLPVDVEGFSADSSVTTEVECDTPAGGSRTSDGDDDVIPEPIWQSESQDRGLEAGEVHALCDRARSARLAGSVQAGFGALALLWGGVTVLRRRPAPSV